MDFTYYERSLHISLATKVHDLRALTTDVEALTKVVLEKSEALLADLGDKKKKKDVQKTGLELFEKQKSLEGLIGEVNGVLGRLTTEVESRYAHFVAEQQGIWMPRDARSPFAQEQAERDEQMRFEAYEDEDEWRE